MKFSHFPSHTHVCTHGRVRLFATPWTVAHEAVHRILQARILEWVAISSSKGSSWSRGQTMSPASPALAGGFFTTAPLGKSIVIHISLSKWLWGLQGQRIPWLERTLRWVHGTEHFCTPQGMHHAKNDRTVCCPNTYVVCPDISLVLLFAWTSIYEECTLTFAKRSNCVQ